MSDLAVQAIGTIAAFLPPAPPPHPDSRPATRAEAAGFYAFLASPLALLAAIAAHYAGAF